MKAARGGWLVLGLVLLAALVRLPLLTAQGLWVDEVFSLALATGHSLEQPAAESDPALGDFVEGARPAPASAWQRYLEHEDPPADLGRVLRAVQLSDTNPPLYYVGLWGWTRLFGTSDAALRAFSLACALAGLPLLLALARRTGGPAAVLPAGVLFALLPLALYYSTEGRMYALLWLCTLASAWATLEFQRRGPRPGLLVLWGASAVAGFLTHYFFVFPWAALCLVLVLRPGRCARERGGRLRLALVPVLTLAAIAPWYAGVPASLARWRVTQGWLEWKPIGFERVAEARELFLQFFTGAEENLWGEHRLARAGSLALFAALLALFLWRRRARAFTGRALVPWLWLAAAWAGPLVFDAWRHTYTVAVARYAVGGLPAAVLLAAAALARLGPRLRLAWLAALVLVLLPHHSFLYRRASRAWCPLREVARSQEASTNAGELVLVHSIPSGVLGVARYYRGPADIGAWVGQLGERRVPESLQELARGATRVHLVLVHEVGAPAPEEDWLRAHATLLWEGKREAARLSHFAPAAGERF